MMSAILKPTDSSGSSPFHPRLLLIGIILLAFFLRVLRLDFQPLWWDEGYSLFFATRDFTTMLERTAVDIHPPLYYALLQAWMAFVGKSDLAARLLSVFVGVATIPLLYALARRLYETERISLLASFILAIAPLHVYYSQEVRMYGLVTLLGLGSVYSFVRLLGSDRKDFLWLVYIALTAAALYTQYYAAFVLAVQVIAIVILKIRNSQHLQAQSPLLGCKLSAISNLHWLSAWLIITLLYLPWALFAGAKLYAYVTFKVGHEAYAAQNPITYFLQHLIAFSSGHLSDFSWLAWGSVIFVAIAALGFATHSVHANRFEEEISAETNSDQAGDTLDNLDDASDHAPFIRAALIPLCFLVPLALGYLVHLRFPFYPVRVERLLLLATPAFYLLVALGLAALMSRRYLTLPTLLIAIGLSSLSLYDFYTVPRYPNDDYRPLLADMQSVSQPGDNFLAIYPWQIGYLEAYYAGAPLTIVETPNDAWIADRAQMQREVDAHLSQHPRVWLPALQTLGRILEDSLDSYLRGNKYAVVDSWYGTTRLEYFASGDDPPVAAKSISFENGAAIPQWGMSTHRVFSGQDILRVFFDLGNDFPSGYKLSLRLFDKKGNLWTQDDRGIERGTQRVGLFVPTGTPPGQYDLRLTLYRVADSSALRLGDKSDSISLGQVLVESPAPPNLAAVSHRVSADFDNGIRLNGYDALSQSIKPGEVAGVTLIWQATRKQDKDYAVAIQLQDWLGKNYLVAQDSLARGVYPTSQWQPNELVRDPHPFTINSHTPDGLYRLLIALVDPANQSVVKSAPVATVQIRSRPHFFGAPAPSKIFKARVGNFAQLIGYDSGYDEARKQLKLILYWQAIGHTQTSYKVFAHVVDGNGNLRAQRDQIPGSSAFPTTSWVTGEFLVDPYEILLDELESDFQFRIGLYDPATGARLTTFDSANQPTGDYITLPAK